MARKAFVSSSMSFDERLIGVGEACPIAPLLWPYLITYFDDWGRAEASPTQIKAQVFPLFEAVKIADIRDSLAALGAGGVITLYSVNGKDYMAVHPETWFKYQTHVRGEKRLSDKGSKIPCAQLHADWWQKANPAAENEELHAPARNLPDLHAPARSCIPSPSPSPSPSGEGSAVEKHGAVPYDELPPPQDAEEWVEAGVQRTYPDADRLHEAFYSVRYPTRLFNPNPEEIAAARRVFIPMAEAGITLSEVKQATATAMRRFRDRTQVTPAAVARNWSALLEDDPPPAEEAPPRSAKVEGTHGSAAYQVVTSADLRAALERPARDIPNFVPPWVQKEAKA